MPGSLGYVPYLRPGAILFNAVVFRYLASGKASREQAISDVYGHIGGRKRNLLGGNMLTASSRLFGASASPLEVLRRHTLFGIYSHSLPPERTHAFASALIYGIGRRSVNGEQWLRRGLPRLFPLSVNDLRSCAKCISEDLENFGYPLWDILHLIPPVGHCPRHGNPLAVEIRGVDRNAWDLKLPSGVVPQHVSDFRPSDGYAMYLKLWVELFEGRLSAISADNWSMCMDSAVCAFGSNSDALDGLGDAVRRLWNSDPDDIGRLLGSHLEQGFIQSELEQRSAPSRVAQKLVVMTGLSSLGILSAVADDGSGQMSFRYPNGPSADSGDTTSLIRHQLLSSGYPTALAPHLLKDAPISRIAIECGVHRHRLGRAIGTLSPGLLKVLESARSWSPRSWLAKELARRRG
jgi:hypothetical protein